MIPGELDIAAVNGPRQCVVAGEATAIDRLSTQLSGLAVPSMRLATDKAFHSHATDAVASEFRRLLEGVTFRAPSLQIASNVTATWLTDAEATDPGYWVAHLRRPVRFHDGIVTLMEPSTALLCEVGPGRALACLVEMQRFGAPLQFVTSTQSDQAFEETLAAAWALGVDVRLQSPAMDSLGRMVALPTYPFERARHSIDRLEWLWSMTARRRRPHRAMTPRPGPARVLAAVGRGVRRRRTARRAAELARVRRWLTPGRAERSSRRCANEGRW